MRSYAQPIITFACTAMRNVCLTQSIIFNYLCGTYPLFVV
nr:MAG TPA: hypothetical protein [Caudoviricetes sp.]